MSLRRVAQSFSVVAVAGVLAGSSYVTGPSTASGSQHEPRHHVHNTRFTAPVPHKYLPNGMRMGLHCETSELGR